MEDKKYTVLLLTPNKHEPRIQCNTRYLISIFHRSNWLQTNCNRIANVCMHWKCWSKCEKKENYNCLSIPIQSKVQMSVWTESVVKTIECIERFQYSTFRELNLQSFFFIFVHVLIKFMIVVCLSPHPYLDNFCDHRLLNTHEKNSFRLIWIKITWCISYVYRMKHTRVNTKSLKKSFSNPKNKLNFRVDRKLTAKWNENW